MESSVGVLLILRAGSLTQERGTISPNEDSEGRGNRNGKKEIKPSPTILTVLSVNKLETNAYRVVEVKIAFRF